MENTFDRPWLERAGIACVSQSGCIWAKAAQSFRRTLQWRAMQDVRTEKGKLVDKEGCDRSALCFWLQPI